MRRGRAAAPSRGSRIHEGLVGDRALIGERYLADADLRRSYAEEIAPRTGAALTKIFGEIAPERTGVTRVLDLGAGTGAAGKAAREHFGDIDVTSVDQVPAVPGVIVADLARTVRPPRVEGRFDLIIAAHLLNELPLTAGERAALVLRWSQELLAPHGRIVLLEPALRETSRALLAVRDDLLTAGLHVVAPCIYQGACPARARDRDWCHDAAPAIVDGRSRVDFSYLVLTLDRPASSGLYRIVSDRLVDKGRTRAFACGPTGRHELIRLTRDASPQNAAFEGLQRGDRVELSPAAEAPVSRLGPDTAVTRRETGRQRR